MRNRFVDLESSEPVHMHPVQTEYFEVLKGTPRAWVDGCWELLGAGSCVHIEPG